MNVYSIHVRDNNQAPKLVLVKDGYCLAATIFGPLWALVLGLWETAIIIFIFYTLMGFLINEFVPGANAAMAAQAGAAVLIGIVANELRRWNLERRGFEERDTVLGSDRSDAERRFFEANPDVLAQLEGAA
ncbi:MAG: DUF2628 domain-containing protein [Rhodospirillaceae bacterium]|nr:DUF2628 domain-containing protein [Rhodospirillaceae bacterium]